MAAVALASVMVVAVHAWTLVPGVLRLAPASYEPRLDLSNELFGWPGVVDAVRQEATDAASPGDARGDVAVVGPHWVVCAQLEAALRGEWPVGCDTEVPDDFDAWWPRARWRAAEAIVWVSDARFETGSRLPTYAPLMATFVPLRSRQVRVERDGRPVRFFTLTLLGRRAGA